MQLFHGRKQNLYSFLLIFAKLYLCILVFLHLFLWSQNETFTTLLFHVQWFVCDLIHKISQIGQVPHPKQWFSKDHSLKSAHTKHETSYFTKVSYFQNLCFGGKKRCRIFHVHFCQLKSPIYHKRRICVLASKKDKLNTQIRTSPVVASAAFFLKHWDLCWHFRQHEQASSRWARI